jgi:hypothetical protein
MFQVLGVAVAAYATFAIGQGEVYGKSGVWGRTVQRDSSPQHFWTVVSVYFALALVLLFAF